MPTQPHIEPARPGPITDTLLEAMIGVAHNARDKNCTQSEAETMMYLLPELLEELSASRKAIAGMDWFRDGGPERIRGELNNVVHIHRLPEATE